MPAWSPGPGGATALTMASATANLSQAAGTYDLLTATGDVMLEWGTVYVVVAGVGFTSWTIVTDNTTPITILASTTLANTTIDKNLGPFWTPQLLVSTKKIRYTIVGTGSGGSARLVMGYRPVTAGAVLA